MSRPRSIGVYSGGAYPAKIDGKSTREYSLWANMLWRCYDSGMHERFPTYAFASASDNFLNFQYFAEWCNNQTGFTLPGATLDKDLLNKGNKHYHEDRCVFIPDDVNKLLITRRAKRGQYPIGVSWNCGAKKFQAILSCGKGGKKKNLGYYTNVEDAFAAYKKGKEALVQQVAREYKAVLDNRAYEALMQFEVDVND